MRTARKPALFVWMDHLSAFTDDRWCIHTFHLGYFDKKLDFFFPNFFFAPPKTTTARAQARNPAVLPGVHHLYPWRPIKNVQGRTLPGAAQSQGFTYMCTLCFLSVYQVTRDCFHERAGIQYISFSLGRRSPINTCKMNHYMEWLAKQHFFHFCSL